MSSLPTGTPPPDRIATIPNAVTLLRFLLLIPACYLIVTRAQGWGTLVLLGVWASTDWVDGFLARALDQKSRFGQMFDPVTDRIGIGAVVVCLAYVDALSWMAVLIVLAMDALALVLVGPAASRGEVNVSYLGKARTAVMFVGIVALVAQVSGVLALGTFAQILIGIGLILHIVVGITYIREADRVTHTRSEA